MTQPYLIPDKGIQTEYEIKKSRFIARLNYANDRAQAIALLEQAKEDYPDARHHCWAYLIGHPTHPHLVAMSDDGEPSGTAGKPILNVMQHKPVGDCMLIVIRYFGGIKLGAGGLVRAYSHAAQQAYDQVTTRLQTFRTRYLIHCDFSEEQSIRHWLSLNDGEVIDCHYREQVTLSITLAEEKEQALSVMLSAQKHASYKRKT